MAIAVKMPVDMSKFDPSELEFRADTFEWDTTPRSRHYAALPLEV